MRSLSPLGRLFSTLVFCAACLAAIISGCTQGTSVTGGGPSGIRPVTLTLTSAEVYWTRDPTDTSTDTVIVMNGANLVTEVPEPFPHSLQDSALVNGLTSGVLYKIYIATSSGHSSSITYTLYLPEVPTNVTVTSVAGRSASFSWTRFPTDTSFDTIFITTPNGALVGDTIVPAGTSIASFSGLTPGGTYVIIIATKTGRSTPIIFNIAGAVLNLAVNSLSATSIGVEWTRSLGDSTKYDDTIFVTDISSGTVIAKQVQSSLSPPASGGIISNLVLGKMYRIAVHSLDTISDTILWMTAERIFGLHLYEIDDTLGDSTSIQIPSTTSTLILDTNSKHADSVDLASDSSLNHAKILMSLNDTTVVGGLMNDYRRSSYAADTSFITSQAFQIPSGRGYDTTGSVIIQSLILPGTGSNFLLIEIVPNASGTLYSYSPKGERFITINLSYQPTANDPYAGRGRTQTAKILRRSAH